MLKSEVITNAAFTRPWSISASRKAFREKRAIGTSGPKGHPMPSPIEPLSTSILAIMYFGDVVFAVSGALTAARYRMDVLGFVLIGTITGIGGGTTRDVLLGRHVWWTQNPTELMLCVVASLITFFFITSDITRRKGMIWADADAKAPNEDGVKPPNHRRK